MGLFELLGAVLENKRGCSQRIQNSFWKNLFLAPKCAYLGGHLPTWRPRPGTTGEFGAQTLGLGKPHVNTTYT